MFGETTISQVKVWNHPTETTILKWMFHVPGRNVCEITTKNEGNVGSHGTYEFYHRDQRSIWVNIPLMVMMYEALHLHLGGGFKYVLFSPLK